MPPWRSIQGPSRWMARSTARRPPAKPPDQGTFRPGTRPMGMNRAVPLLAALVVAGCGAQAAPPGPSGTVSATNGPFAATARPASLPAGGTVHLTLTVTGPIDYEVGCVQTVHI